VQRVHLLKNVVLFVLEPRLDRGDRLRDPGQPKGDEVPEGRVSRFDPPEVGMRLEPREDLACVGVLSAVHGVARQLVTGIEAALAVDFGQEMNAVGAGALDGGVRMEGGAQPRPGNPGQVTLAIRRCERLLE
jgi:hypothetical protein